LNRREFVQAASKMTAGVVFGTSAAKALAEQTPQTMTLKKAAASTGRIMACFTGAGSLKNAWETRIRQAEFGMLADGFDLKMDHIRPDPQSFNFADGDFVSSWCRDHGMLLRGHCLIWHNALPGWFSSYVNKGNARQVMTDHISKTMGHFKGQMYSWDVVNEMIFTQDRRPDGLRIHPWLDLVGTDYIDVALHTAAAADPAAKIIINENTLEHDLPLDAQRRDALLALCKALKKRNVPLHGVGLQSHLVGGVPFATAGMQSMLSQMRDLGMEILITELDVDDAKFSGPTLDEQVAQTYVQYLKLVGPYTKVICLEALGDRATESGQIAHARLDGQPHRPNLFDPQFKHKGAYNEVLEAISSLPKI
jgi:endo-1,4-beta-xylanase